MYGIDYYTQASGKQPARVWIEKQDAALKVTVDKRLDELRLYGLELASRRSKILKPIVPDGKTEKRINGLYELRYTGKGKQWRIAVYHCQGNDRFVLIDGWRKTQAVQPADIKRAKGYVRDYLRRKGTR